jgi:fumarate reductase iron-sulfur subunit
LADEHGVWDCTLVGECTTVCPADVDPAAAIQQIKLSTAVDWIKRALRPRGGA